MSIPYVIDEPVEGVYPAYLPSVYEFGWLQNQGVADPAIEIEVLINGQKFGSSIFPSIYTKSSPLGGIDAFVWRVQADGPVQRYFNNQLFFRPPASVGCVGNDGWQAEVSLRAYLYLPDNDGVLQREADFLDTQIINFINATANILEPRTLEDYIAVSNATTKYLTNKPGRVLIGLDESEWLSLISFGTTGTNFRFYGLDGSLIGEGSVFHPATGPENYRVLQVGVGPANINAMESADWYTSSGSVVVDENVSFYIVRSGLACQDGSFWGNFSTRRYIPYSGRGRTFRFHFVNGFGGVDSLSVYDYGRRTYEIKSDTFRRSLPPVINSDTVSVQRLQSTGTLTLEGWAQNLTPSEVEFMKYFLRTPNLIWEEDELYYACVAEDQTIDVKQAARGLSSVKFRCRLSMEDITQNN